MSEIRPNEIQNDAPAEKSLGDTFSLTAPTTPDKHWYDEEHKAINIVFAASLDQDRIGDFLEVTGIDTSEHQKNPVAYLDHGDGTKYPIGKCVDPDGNYTVTIEDGYASAKVYLDCGIPGFDEPSKVFELYKRKTLIGGSIGYRLIDFDIIQPNPEKGYFRKAKHIKRCELLEVTITSWPMNQDTVVKNLSSALNTDMGEDKPLTEQKDMEAMSAVDQSSGGSLVGESKANHKAGAVALKELHGSLNECKSLACEHAGYVEQPHVKRLLEKLHKSLMGCHKEVAQAHNEQYPENEPLEHEEDNDEVEHKSLAVDEYANLINTIGEKIKAIDAKWKKTFGQG